MTDDVPDYRGELSNHAAIANLHTLTVNMNAMRRLLGRKTEGGELVRADAALIETAIKVGREEARKVRNILEGLQDITTNPLHPSRDEQIIAITKIDDLLDDLECMLHNLSV